MKKKKTRKLKNKKIVQPRTEGDWLLYERTELKCWKCERKAEEKIMKEKRMRNKERIL